MRLGISLTKESLHRRNIANFGPTTLRPTIAYCMLRSVYIGRPSPRGADTMWYDGLYLWVEGEQIVLRRWILRGTRLYTGKNIEYIYVPIPTTPIPAITYCAYTKMVTLPGTRWLCLLL